MADDTALIGVYFQQHAHVPDPRSFGGRVEPNDDPLLDLAARELEAYFAGELREFSVPTRTTGDAFSEAVWDQLREIPYGTTVSYGFIAKALGNVLLSQRVGQTVGRNPVSIIVPCHRVIGADGSLTGFGGGLERKRILLELEEPEEVKGSRLF